MEAEQQDTPEEVHLVDGWENDGHQTVPLKEETLCDGDVWNMSSTRKCVQYLSRLDQLGGSWFIITGWDSNLQQQIQMFILETFICLFTNC